MIKEYSRKFKGFSNLIESQVLYPWLMLLGLVLLIVQYFTQSTDLNKYYNSDALTIYAFINDFFVANGQLNSWHFSNAPGFLPDFLICAVSFFLSGDTYHQIFISSVLQVIILYVLTHYLLKPFQLPPLAPLITVYAVIALASWDISPYFQILILNWHFGNFLAGLLSLGIYANFLNRCFKDGSPLSTVQCIRLSLFLSLIAFTATVSDVLFLIVFSAPILLASAFFCALRYLRLKEFWIACVPPFLASVLAKTCAPWIIPNFGGLSFAWTSMDNLVRKIHEFGYVLMDMGGVSIYLVVFSIWLFLRAGTSLKNFIFLGPSAFERRKLLQEFFLLYGVIALGINFSVVLFTNALMADRYMPSFYFFPMVFLFIGLEFNKYRTAIRNFLIIFLILCIVFRIYSFSQHSFKFEYHPPDVKCIERAVSKLENPSGIGEYWLTKRFVAFNNIKARMVSFDSKLEPYRVLISNDWYRDDYNFAVIPVAVPEGSMYKINESQIRKLNGEPDRVVQCPDTKVLIYPQGMGTNLLSAPGVSSYRIKACELPRSMGQVPNQNSCFVVIDNKSPQGNITYGPYIKLRPGTYTYSFVYVSQEPLSSEIGYYDLAFLSPDKYQVISQFKIYGSSGGKGTIKGELSIDNYLSKGQFELRTFINPNTPIELRELTVEPTKGYR